jgi:hypothetical protein
LNEEEEEMRVAKRERERERERERVFMIIISYENATVLSNAFGKTIAFPLYKELIGNLLEMVFSDCFVIFPKYMENKRL